jgi:aspartyl-tRNA(Asn)/glutamyl-tRNA(Gln) amidotransferase subunit C
MKVSEKDVAYVAELANLDLTPHEREGMLRDLNSILDYVDLLNEVDTSNVQPMAQVSGHEQTGEGTIQNRSLAEVSRADILEGLRPSLPQDVALANAPDADQTFFRVPKVIER